MWNGMFRRYYETFWPNASVTIGEHASCKSRAPVSVSGIKLNSALDAPERLA